MSDDSMRYDWRRLVNRDPQLTATQRRVLFELESYANADGTNAHPGVLNIAQGLRTPTGHMSKNTVRSALDEGCRRGFIELVTPGSRGAGKAAVYRLIVPANGVGEKWSTQADHLQGEKRSTQADHFDHVSADGKMVNLNDEMVNLATKNGQPGVGTTRTPDRDTPDKNPRRDDSEDEPHVDVEPSAPTPSDAGLFDLADPEPIDAELVDEPTRSPVPAPASKPPKSETPEQRVTAAAYERVGKAFNFIAVRAIAKWAIHDRGEDPAVVEAALVGVHELGRPIMKQTVGQWLDGILSPAGTRPGGMSKQDAKVNRYLDTGRQLKERLAASGVAREERAPITAPSEQTLALPSSPAVDPARDPLAWIDGDLPGGFGPGERDRAAELLENGTDYHRVRWAILQARNARPKPGRRKHQLAGGTTTITAERTIT